MMLRIGDAAFSYLEAGRGAPVVFLHGVGSAGRSFADQIPALAQHYRVLAWDAPGYGLSTAPAEADPDPGVYAAALLKLLDGLDIGPCHLVGHSLGALIAARFAADHSDRVLSLTLCSIAAGHAMLPAEERRRLLDQRLADVAALGPRAMAEKRGPRLLGPDATPEMIRRVIDTMAAIRPDGYGQAARMLSNGDVKADIARLPPGLPLQVVFGEADAITPPARNREIAASRPHTAVHAIEGAGHAVYLEKPEWFNVIVGDFVARHAMDLTE